MKKLTQTNVLFLAAAMLAVPGMAAAQQGIDRPLASDALTAPVVASQSQNVPAAGLQAQDSVRRAVNRFNIGVNGGVSLNPELIDFGAHAAFGPIFHPNVEFRPGIEFGVGEVTTLFAINLDVLYTIPGAAPQTRWTPYVGAGPNFTISHRSVETTTVNDDGTTEPPNRFNFSDTDFTGGFNFIVGMRNPNRVFFEMKATAWGVSNVRLLAGFTF